MEEFKDIVEMMYEDTFDRMYDSLVEEYKSGELSLETLERNIEEQQNILMNGILEGETKFAYTNAIIDAHQFVLTLIKQNKILRD